MTDLPSGSYLRISTNVQGYPLSNSVWPPAGVHAILDTMLYTSLRIWHCNSFSSTTSFLSYDTNEDINMDGEICSCFQQEQIRGCTLGEIHVPSIYLHDRWKLLQASQLFAVVFMWHLSSTNSLPCLLFPTYFKTNTGTLTGCLQAQSFSNIVLVAHNSNKNYLMFNTQSTTWRSHKLIYLTPRTLSTM